MENTGSKANGRQASAASESSKANAGKPAKASTTASAAPTGKNCTCPGNSNRPALAGRFEVLPALSKNDTLRWCNTLALPVGVLYPHTPTLLLYPSFLHSFCQGIAPKNFAGGVLYPHTPKLLRDLINMLLYVT